MAPLAAKIEHSMERIRDAVSRVGPRATAVAWTGGKDSTVCLHLLQRVLAATAPGSALRAVSVDTGCKFPETVAFREQLARQWGVELAVARPKVDASAYPLARDPVSCCRDLKIEPLGRVVAEQGIAALIVGVRRDEHPSRADTPELEERTGPDHLRLHPLAAWREIDVWAYMIDNRLPWCELYDAGYRSLGCMPCTGKPEGRGERAGRARHKEQAMNELRSLGYF